MSRLVQKKRGSERNPPGLTQPVSDIRAEGHKPLKIVEWT